MADILISRPRGRQRRRRRFHIRPLGALVLLGLSAVVTAFFLWFYPQVPLPPAAILPPPSNLAKIALSQEGENYQTYCDWWGFPERQEWCGVFVAWCADQAGYIADIDYLSTRGTNADIGQPRDNGAGAGSHARFHNKMDLYFPRESGYLPKSGDLIYFDWDVDNHTEGDLVMDHIGIVEQVWSNHVYTIEGNSNLGEDSPDLVRRKSYLLTDPRIRGYSRFPQKEEDS